ncbi:MAG: glycosyltransferase [Mycobacteriales bacterium]
MVALARRAPAGAYRAGHAAPARRRLSARRHDRPLRVLHVNDQPVGHGGGAEVNLGRLVAAQRAAGDEPHVLAGEVRHDGVRRALDLWDPAARRLVARRVTDLQPDVVHLHNVVRELSPSVIGVIRDRPVVLTVHDMRLLSGSEHHLPHPRAAADRWILTPVARRAIRRLPAVLAVSETVAASLRSAGVRSVHVVPVPVPPPLVAPRAAGECTDVLFAASLAADKGAHVLLAAFGQVADRFPTARLVLAGSGPEAAALARATAPWGSRVLLPGRLDGEGVSRAMGEARVVVVPSLPALRREGSSLTAAEAARHARPVVTSDDPAAAEVARTVGGDVVPAGDVGALAGRLDHWLADPAAATAAGTLAADRAGAYDSGLCAASVRKVYLEALDGRG